MIKQQIGPILRPHRRLIAYAGLAMIGATAISLAQTDGKFTADDQAALVAQLKALKVDVNPRYGSYDPNTASVQLTTPGWVTPHNAPQ